MPKDTTISSFRGVKKAIIILFVMVIFTESYAYLIRKDLVSDYWNKLIINEQALVTMDKDFDYLVMGDSLQKTGIKVTLLDRSIALFTLPGGKPMGLYILLKRYLEYHSPPKAIFLYIDPGEPMDSLHVVIRYFFTVKEMLEIWSDLTFQEKTVFFWRFWSTLDLRRADIIKRQKYELPNDVLVGSMVEENGFFPAADYDNKLDELYFIKTEDRVQGDISISERDLKYLDKFMKLAGKNNIDVILLGALVPKGLYDINEATGFNAIYSDFLRGLLEKYPGTYFYGDPVSFMPNNFFGDSTHLNREGVLVYTAYFRDNVMIPYLEDKKLRR